MSWLDTFINMAETLLDHIHSPSKVYPTLADGVTVTGAAGAWTLGAFAVVVPAGTITRPFDIHGIGFDDVSADDQYELVLYGGADGSEAEIGRVRFHRASGGGAHPALDESHFQCAVQAANTQIKAKIASKGGGSDTATISVRYHTY